MLIRNLALKLIEQSEVEVYSMLNIIRDMSTNEARAKARAREREYAAKAAWRKCNAKYRQIQHQFKHTHTKKI